MMDTNTDDCLYEIGDDEIGELNGFRLLQHLFNQIMQELSVNNLDGSKQLVRMAQIKSKVMFSARLEDIRLSSSEFSERNIKALDEMSGDLDRTNK
jgi:hypothetical protein